MDMSISSFFQNILLWVLKMCLKLVEFLKFMKENLRTGPRWI